MLERKETYTKNFKEYVKTEMMKSLQNRKAALEGHENDKIEISTIFFAYNHGEIIRTLKERGNLVFK